MAVFWDVAPCNLVDIDLRGVALMIEAVASSEVSPSLYQI
jgi:hypothetical protein